MHLCIIRGVPVHRLSVYLEESTGVMVVIGKPAGHSRKTWHECLHVIYALCKLVCATFINYAFIKMLRIFVFLFVYMK